MSSKQVMGFETSFEVCLKGNSIDLGVFVHHREVYEQLGGFDTHLTRLVDWDLILRYIKSYDAKFIEEILMLYNDYSRKDRISQKEDFALNYEKILRKYS